MPGIHLGKRVGSVGQSWSSYWATLISATVEDAAQSNVILTFPSAKTSLVKTDLACTVNGAARAISSASWTGGVWTAVLSSAVIYGDVVVMTFGRTLQTASVTNNVELDVNAAAFLTAQSNTDETQKKALNKFVIDLKVINATQSNFVNFDTPASSVLKAIYPFIGGSAAKHKFNLINPADSDAAFRLTFAGTLTHDANGIDPDGSSGYANTHFKPAANITVNSESIGYYCLENTTKDAIDCGIVNSGTLSAEFLSLAYAALGGVNVMMNAGSGLKITATSQTRGFWLANRISNVRFDLYRNHELIASNTTANNQNPANLDYYLFACNDQPSGGAKYFTDRRCCYAHIASGISDAAIQLYIKAVQDLQEALGRGDIYVPLMATSGSYIAGARVKKQLDGWNSNIYHSLYLPVNYTANKTWPVIIDTPGNAFENGNGTPNDYHLGYGLSKGRDFIWVVAPFINADRTNIATVWWGDGSSPVTQSIDSTTDYWDAILADLEANYHADLTKVVLMGFSRGAIACGYIGCHDDAYASKFITWMPHSSHDGGTFTAVGGATRLARMLGKKTCITSGANGLDAQYANTQTGLGIVQAAGVTEEHYTIADMGHDYEHALRIGDATVDSIRTFLAQYK